MDFLRLFRWGRLFDKRRDLTANIEKPRTAQETSRIKLLSIPGSHLLLPRTRLVVVTRDTLNIYMWYNIKMDHNRIICNNVKLINLVPDRKQSRTLMNKVYWKFIFHQGKGSS
jgi:hypothetical protein